MVYSIDMDEQKFKEKLTPEQYRVMRQKGAEQPFTGKYWDSDDGGTYACAACGNELFSSEDKFDADSGYPSFKKAMDENKIELVKDPATPNRTELRCKNCASHLGFLINGKEKYYQLNSASLELEGNDDEEEDEEESGNKSDKLGKAKTGLKMLAIGSAITVAGLALGATAGTIICRNSPAPIPAPAFVATTTAGEVIVKEVIKEVPVIKEKIVIQDISQTKINEYESKLSALRNTLNQTYREVTSGTELGDKIIHLYPHDGGQPTNLDRIAVYELNGAKTQGLEINMIQQEYDSASGYVTVASSTRSVDSSSFINNLGIVLEKTASGRPKYSYKFYALTDGVSRFLFSFPIK